ncbi:MAG: MFS transporter [Gemmatimonadetes bacterium]|nr:MAG: MFS transporter [Gemmatimonadota bacterium]
MSTTAFPETTAAPEKTFFGHPRGLSTLFFTEMWERFSYYGMRALLILYMTAAATGTNPGMGLDVGTAAAIYGLYTSLVYLLALPGGWVADNLWGQQKAVYVGGWIIAAGHFSMAIPTDFTFFLGLVLIVMGTGLLKPNVSTVVGDLYPEGGARRDAGFSIFYMGINLGALFGPLLTSFLGEGYNWHWGFSLAGFGMLAGLMQFRYGRRYLGEAGVFRPTVSPEVLRARTRTFFGTFFALLAAVVFFGWLVAQGTIPLTLQQIAKGLGSGILILVGLYFAYLLLFGGHTTQEKKNLVVILWLFVLIAVFWSGFEQAGSSMNLFAREYTDRNILGWLMPAGFLQSVNSTFIILLAPVFGWLWVWLARRNANPSIPVKFALGLFGLAAGFFVLAWGAANASAGNLVSPAWLVVTYFLHTVGELAISPVGLSSITKLSPAGRVGQMMGIWFVGAALGNLFAGLVAGSLETLPPADLFRTVALTVGGVGLLALLVSPLIRRLIGPDVE